MVINHKSAFSICVALLIGLSSIGCVQQQDGQSPPNLSSSSGNDDGKAAATLLESETGIGRPILGELSDFSLIDHAGEPYTLQDMKGNITIANFIFTTCPGTCPAQSQWMSKLCDHLKKQQIDSGIRLISFTVDPEHDTSQVLEKYGQQFSADFRYWTFLTGDKEQIWSLSGDSFHLPVADNPDDPLIPIAHDSTFVVIDRSGQIRAYHNVLTENSLDPLLKTIDFVLPEFSPQIDQYPQLASARVSAHLAQPPSIVNSTWLNQVAVQEKEALEQSSVRRDFTFERALARSRITFSPQIVDDQRWRLIVNHYDHGNSVSAADVDGDSRTDLYFVSQVGPNELWRNLGDGSFANITESAKVGMSDQLSVAASFADVDNDGDADLYVTTVRGTNKLFINDGTGQFTDVTRKSGLEYSGHSSTGVFFDYNNDGLLDLYLTNVGKYTTDENAVVRQDLCNSQSEIELSYYVGRTDAFAGHLKKELQEQSVLYKNVGEHQFEDVSETTGLTDFSWSGDALPLDINNDGWLDLYVLNMQGSDHLYVNEQGVKFVDKTLQYFPETPWGAMGAATFDFDRDGRFDLFLTDMHSDMSEDIGPDREKLKSRMQWPKSFLGTDGSSIFGNAFFLAGHAGHFVEVSQDRNAENYWPWGLSTGDLNADGFTDAFLTSSMCFPYRYGMNSLLLNDSGEKFLDAQMSLHIEPRPERDRLAPWFSLDCDGQDSEHRMCQGREGTIIVWSAQGTRSSVLLDIEQDGDLDIVTNEFNTPPQIFLSTLSKQTDVNSLTIQLQGTKSNRDGLGAVVTVLTNREQQTLRHDGKSGYLAQSRMPLYVGLGQKDAVEKIIVQWPSGVVQSIPGPIAANQQLTIVEKAE